MATTLRSDDNRASPAEPPADESISSIHNNNNELDVVRIIQERDAYKQETEKLWKIIEKQRFIIKSLQGQISRKLSVSTINTPSIRSSDLTPEPLEKQQAEESARPAAADVEVDSRLSAASNALGLSSLNVASPPQSLQPQLPANPSIRDIVQASQSGPMPVPEYGEPTELNASTTNLRPWAKSTRLSEIYADYSARHNSTAPLPRPTTADWSTDGDEGKQQRIVSTGNNSFIDDVKPQHRSGGWQSRWADDAAANNGYHRGSGNGGSRISSLVADSSRAASLSMEETGGDAPHPDYPPGVNTSNNTSNNTSSAAPRHMGGSHGGPNSLDINTDSVVPAAVPNHSLSAFQSSTAGLRTEPIREDRNVVTESSIISPILPPESPMDQPDSATENTHLDHLVLRPISIVDESSETDHLDNGSSDGDRPLASNSEWQASELAGYEYGEPALGPEEQAHYPSHQLQHQQPQPHLLKSQQQASQFGSPSFGPSTSNGPVSTDPPAASGSAPNASIRAFIDSHSLGPTPYPKPTMNDALYSTTHSRDAASASAATGGAARFAPSGEADEHQHRDSDTMPPTQHATGDAQGPPKYHQDVPTRPPLASVRNIDVQIKDSRVKIDERGKEVNVYMIDVIYQQEPSGMSLKEILAEAQKATVLWTVEKRYSDFLNLNGKLRQAIHKERVSAKLERLPDKDIFRANAPTKNDKRKQWFERYLRQALTLSVEDKTSILEFLSTNVAAGLEKSMPILLGHKEGFLVKKGKNFGGWKRRYYVCKSNMPILEYAESPGGAPIGMINLRGAVVKTGKSRSDDSSVSRSKSGQKDDMFRHAFLIEEKPKRDGKEPVAHPLWADSDRERDEWVTALRYVIVRDSDGPERAMDEITKYAAITSTKDSNLSMIHQIHASLTHEQGIRRSLEYNRMKEEQRQARGAPNNGREQQPNGPPTQAAAGINKTVSPLSKQAWPATASLGDIGRPNQGGSYAQSSADGNSSSSSNNNNSSAIDSRDHASGFGESRPRSLSFSPNESPRANAGANSRLEAPRAPNKPSPAEIAATLSASFSGQDSAPTQQDRVSVHYAPSEISTIESSLYSSYHDNDPNSQANVMSSRSIDGRDSYFSMPDSPTNPQSNIVEISYALRNAGALGPLPPPKDSTPMSMSANAASPAKGPYSQPPSKDPTAQMFQSIAGKPKTPFTKDSVGRIVREEENAPELPTDTPHVTDDILGIGRHEAQQADGRGAGGGNSAGALANIFNGSRTRSREEKKRGRITFMWGKRKQSEHDNVHPEQLSAGSGANGAGNSGAAPDMPPVPAPGRRLRRGSTSNDALNVPVKHKTPMMPVFGLPLELAVQATKVREHYELPAVVYRCIEYLDAKKAWLEEGIYRQSGSFSALDSLRKSFNTCRDYNLLKLSSPPDIHAVASLLKAYLRELPQSVLTPQLHQDFVRVVDLAERRDRIHELGRLVSSLPLANYTLLRALTAHLIRIVQKASTNKMTLRNIGIVFSPSLGIPVGVFSLLMVEFEYIFWVNDNGSPEPRSISAATGGSLHKVANDPNELNEPTIEPPQGPGRYDRPLSVSMPAGINRMLDDDNIHSAGSGTGNDAASFVSDLPAHPGLVVADHSGRRDLLMRSNGTELDREGSDARQQQQQQVSVGTGTFAMAQPSKDSVPVARVADNTLSMAAVTNTPWYTESGMEGADDMGFKEFQRQLGKSNPQAVQREQHQAQGKLSGRNNRNSIRYSVGAPRELIYKETDISVPAAITEYDDDSSVNEDPMMRLSRHGSNQTLQSTSTAAQQH